LQADWTHKELPSFQLGIGIDTDMAMVGMAGTERQKSFHVLGRCVSTSALLRDLNAQLQTHILVSQYVQSVANPWFRLRIVDFLQFDDSHNMKVYELVEEEKATTHNDEWMYNLANLEENNPNKLYDLGFRKFSVGDIAHARCSFSEHQAQFPSDCHVARLLRLCSAREKGGGSIKTPYARRIGPPWQVFEGE
jgi:hypothetical protein